MAKRKINIELTGLNFCVLVAIVTIVSMIMLHFIVQPTYIQENNIVAGNLTEEIQQSLNKTANHTYIFADYDCTEFSYALVQSLAEKNISAYCVSGFVKEGWRWYGHTWVEVILNKQITPLEATGGYIIPEEWYKSDYFIVKKGFCF